MMCGKELFSNESKKAFTNELGAVVDGRIPAYFDCVTSGCYHAQVSRRIGRTCRLKLHNVRLGVDKILLSCVFKSQTHTKRNQLNNQVAKHFSRQNPFCCCCSCATIWLRLAPRLHLHRVDGGRHQIAQLNQILCNVMNEICILSNKIK